MAIPRMTARDEERIADAIGAAAADPDAERDPDAALAKAAEDAGLPPGHLPILVRAYNTARAGLQRDRGGDAAEKAAGFAVASVGGVAARMFPEAEPKAAAAAGRPAWARAHDPAPFPAEGFEAAMAAWRADSPAAPPAPPSYASARTKAASAMRTLAAAKSEAGVAKFAAARALDALADALLPADALPWADLRAGAAGRHGVDGEAVMLAVRRKLGAAAKRASVDPLHAAAARPREYALLDAAVARVREADAAAEIATLARPVVEAKVAAEMGPFLPPGPPEPDEDDPFADIGKEAGPLGFGGDVVRATAMGKARDYLERLAPRMMSPADPTADHGRPTYEQSLQRLSDPAHEAKVRDLEDQFAVQSMLVDDPVLASYPPRAVASAFNEISKTAPHLASQPLLMRPLLRKALVAGGLDSFEADQAANVEGRLLDQSKAPLESQKLRLDMAKLQRDLAAQPRAPEKAEKTEKATEKEKSAPATSEPAAPPSPPPAPATTLAAGSIPAWRRLLGGVNEPASAPAPQEPATYDLAADRVASPATPAKAPAKVPDWAIPLDELSYNLATGDRLQRPGDAIPLAGSDESYAIDDAADFPASSPDPTGPVDDLGFFGEAEEVPREKVPSREPAPVKTAFDLADGDVAAAAAHLAKVAAAARARPRVKAADGEGWGPDLASLWNSAKSRLPDASGLADAVGGYANDAASWFRGLPSAAQAALAGSGVGALGGGATALMAGKSKRRAIQQALAGGAMGAALGGGGGFAYDRLAAAGPVAGPDETKAVFRTKNPVERLGAWYAGMAPEGTTALQIVDDAITDFPNSGAAPAWATATDAGKLVANHPGLAAGLAVGHVSRGREIAARNELARYRAGLASTQAGGGAAAAEATRLEQALDASARGRAPRWQTQHQRMRLQRFDNDVARTAHGLGGEMQAVGKLKPITRMSRTGLLRSYRGPALGLLVDRLASDYLDDPSTDTGWAVDAARHIPWLGQYVPR